MGFQGMLLAVLAAGLSLAPAARGAILISGSFGPNGDIGFVSSPPTTIAFGAAGSVYQMDAFVIATGQGSSTDLKDGAPASIDYTFAASQPSANDLQLTYTFVNNGIALGGFQFLFFIDADIDANFTDEWAVVNGALGPGRTYQVGDPSTSTLFTNLGNGALNNTNDFPVGTPGDVAMALGLTWGALGSGQTASFNVRLSDAGSSLGSFSLTQNDPNGDALTLSAEVPEPATLGLSGLTLAGLAFLTANRSLRSRLCTGTTLSYDRQS